MKDYYQILETTPDASQDTIKKKYRFLVQAWHPDKFPDPEHKADAQERTKELNEAFDILKNSAKRAQYDKVRFPDPPPYTEEKEDDLDSEQTDEDIFANENQVYEEDEAEEMRSANNTHQQSVNSESKNQTRDNVERKERKDFERDPFNPFKMNNEKYTHPTSNIIQGILGLIVFVITMLIYTQTDNFTIKMIINIIIGIVPIAGWLYATKR